MSERLKEHAWKLWVRQKRPGGSNPSLPAKFRDTIGAGSGGGRRIIPPIAHRLVRCNPTSSMADRAGPLATIGCEPRQARKGAAVTADSGAGVWLVRDATLSTPPRFPLIGYTACLYPSRKSLPVSYQVLARKWRPRSFQ